MIRSLLLAFVVVAFSSGGFAQAPPGGSGQVQPTRTGDYTVKSSDLKSTLPFNCPSPCRVTMPKSTANWPKGYPVTIINSGTTTVTIHITPTSTVSGMVPPGSSDVLLTAQGNFAVVTADKTNNYVAYGSTGTGGSGPVAGGCAMMVDASNAMLVSPGIAMLVDSAACGSGGGGGIAMMLDATNAMLVSPGIAMLVQ